MLGWRLWGVVVCAGSAALGLRFVMGRIGWVVGRDGLGGGGVDGLGVGG